MAEYIEREAAIAPLRRWQKTLAKTYGKNDEYVKCLDDIIDKLIDIPAADVRPVTKGWWIEHHHSEYGRRLRDCIECSNCRCWFSVEELLRCSFCPNCGADMRES